MSYDPPSISSEAIDQYLITFIPPENWQNMSQNELNAYIRNHIIRSHYGPIVETERIATTTDDLIPTSDKFIYNPPEPSENVKIYPRSFPEPSIFPETSEKLCKVSSVGVSDYNLLIYKWYLDKIIRMPNIISAGGYLRTLYDEILNPNDDVLTVTHRDLLLNYIGHGILDSLLKLNNRLEIEMGHPIRYSYEDLGNPIHIYQGVPEISDEMANEPYFEQFDYNSDFAYDSGSDSDSDATISYDSDATVSYDSDATVSADE